MLAVTVSLFFVLNQAINAQFLEQPGTGTVFVSVQDQVTLTCSVEAGYLIDWLVDFPDVNNSLNAASSTSQNVFIQRSFTFEGVATNRSALSLRETETQTNNQTSITCLAQKSDSTSPPTAGNTVEVVFYGAPSPPSDLNVTEDELGSLNISWSLGFIEGVPVNYTLTVLNLNTTSAQPIIIAGLLDLHYVFETSGPCDVYSFTVTAVTAAGNSTPSQEVVVTSIDQSCVIDNEAATNTQTEDTQTIITLTYKTIAPSLHISISVSAGAAVLVFLTILLFIILYYCYKKGKSGCTISRSDLDTETPLQKLSVPDHHSSEPSAAADPVYACIADPVYDTPGEALASSSAFTMTLSEAYGVSANIKPSPGDSTPFAMMSSPAYGVSPCPQKLD